MANEQRCAKFYEDMMKYEDLWAKNPQAELEAFLAREAVYSPETKERVDDPPLEKFDKQVRIWGVGVDGGGDWVRGVMRSMCCGWGR